MNSENREPYLMEVIRQGLLVSSHRQEKSILGDRSTYIGMSDLAKAECPRAALCGKMLPANESLHTLLPMQRGLWFENGVVESLVRLGLNGISQLEINYASQGVPIRAHLDFTLVWSKPIPAVRILEIKSMAQIPERPYEAHSLQVQGQTDLLCELWNEPAFTYRDENGTKQYENVTFPKLCREHFGMEMPKAPENVSVEGWLLCLSMKDARAFGPYEYDSDSLSEAVKLAQSFWGQIQTFRSGTLSLADMPYAQGFHPLCTCCDFSAECPKFTQGDFQPQWEEALSKLDYLKANRSALDTEIKEYEDALKQVHQLSGTKDWISTGKHRFRSTVTAGRRSLDRQAIKEEIERICAFESIAPIDVDAMFQRHEHEGIPSTRLYVSTVN